MIYNQSKRDLTTENVIRTYKLVQVRCLGNSHKTEPINALEPNFKAWFTRILYKAIMYL